MRTMGTPAHRWDVFIAYPSTERASAQSLFRLLNRNVSVFWDDRLRPGSKWAIEIEKQQRSSRCTVVLVSSQPVTSHTYYLDEIDRAIRLNAVTPSDHEVIPVLLSDAIVDVPYGLGPFQSLRIGRDGDLAHIAQLLLTRVTKRKSWKDYDQLFDLDGYRLAYLPLLNASASDIYQLQARDVSIVRDMQAYHLPSTFQQTAIANGFSNDPSCRLASYDFSAPDKLRLTFSETSYADYLKSGEHLDDPIARGQAKTFRDVFGALVHDGSNNLRPFPLTNITGVGTFLVTKDHHIIVSRHSRQSHVYPGRLTFSASGVMKWGAYPHPFQEAIRKCFEELRHQVNPETFRLIGFGADARKLYFQLMFVEKTEDYAADIIRRCPEEHELIRLPFEIERIVDILVDSCWEPAAEATLWTMSVEEFGRTRVILELRRREDSWGRKHMLDEWDLRAGQHGLLPVMSVRYPASRRERLSGSFVDAVMRFIGRDADKKRVLDVGCGIGRLTERLLARARSVTGIDLCERMLEKAQTRIGTMKTVKHLQFLHGFAQDHQPSRPYDVTICSLVLIHNVGEEEFMQLVAMMCRNSQSIFVFEDVTKNRPTSPHTRLRDSTYIEQEFAKHGFAVAKRDRFALSGDNLVFLKFVRQSRRTIRA
jgi:SAM-dependent methyltransferase